MTEPSPPVPERTFGLSGDARAEHLTRLRDMTGATGKRSRRPLVWLAAACVALLAVAGVLALRASITTESPTYQVQCVDGTQQRTLTFEQEPNIQQAVRACLQRSLPGPNFVPASDTQDTFCRGENILMVFRDVVVTCPAGTTEATS